MKLRYLVFDFTTFLIHRPNGYYHNLTARNTYTSVIFLNLLYHHNYNGYDIFKKKTLASNPPPGTSLDRLNVVSFRISA